MRAPFRNILITGASSGLGAALARAYAGPGVMLALSGRDRGRLAMTATACTAAGAEVESAVLDVADRAGMADWVQGFDRRHPVELVVANAGISAGTASDSPSEGVEITTRQIAVNLLGTVHTIEPLLPAMCGRRAGQVAIVSSIAGLRGLPYSPGYCASKAGVRAYAEALRPRLAAYNVGVTAICPGFFASPMTDRWDGPTPFLFSGEKAARRVKRGIDRGWRRVEFPLPLVLGMRFCDVAPAAIGDAILKRFHFRIRST